MFNQSSSVDFLVPHFWAAFLILNPPSRTSFTALIERLTGYHSAYYNC